MARKLTDRQKVNLIAKWKTGQYTKVQLAKAYKVSESYVRKTIGEIKPENADIVEAAIILEKAKKCDKSAIEVTAINQAVAYRLKKEYSEDNKKVRVYDTSFKILDTIDGILKKGTIEEKVSKGDGIQQFEPRDINADDAVKLATAVDKISVTTNVNQRHGNSQVNIDNTNAQQTKQEIVGYKVQTIE